MIFPEAELEMIQFSHIILIQAFKYAVVACYFMRLFLPAVLPASGSRGRVRLWRWRSCLSSFHLSLSHLTRSCIGNFAPFHPNMLEQNSGLIFFESAAGFVQ